MKTNANKTEQVNNETVVVELTSRENKLINALVSLLYAEPGFSDIDCADLAKATKMKVDEVKGLVGSLVKKELAFTAKTETGGDKEYELVYLAPMAWSLHPSWKEESEFELEIKINDSNVAKPAPAASKAKTASKSKATTTKAPAKPKSTTKSLNDTKAKEEELADNKNRPYSVYGLHGANEDLKGFKKGDPILFTIKGRGEVTGEYTHLHTNNWSPKGYVVIKFEGKIYERVQSKVSKPVTEKKPATKKVVTEKKVATAKKTVVTAKKAK